MTPIAVSLRILRARSSRWERVMLRPLLLFVVSLPLVVLHAQVGPKEQLITDVNALAKATSDEDRDSINLLIKRSLRNLLDQPDGFSISFEDVPLSRVEAPDGAFRLLTWNMPRDDGSNQFEGFLLARQGDRTALYELRDMTKSIPSPEVPELGPDKWYGALYYQVIPVKKGGRTYYTLLGWKGYSKAETRKVIEVLSFKNGKPRFGAPLFGKGKLKSMRKVYGFSFQATMTLRYDAKMEGILMDHLSPSQADMKDQRAFYGPDMTHDAYFWYKGEWWFEPDIDARDRKQDGRPFNAPPKPPKP